MFLSHSHKNVKHGVTYTYSLTETEGTTNNLGGGGGGGVFGYI